MMTRHTHVVFRIAVMLGIPSVGATMAGDFEMARSTIDGGGVMFSTGGTFELSGTIGQPDAGVMRGDPFTLTGGFWFETPQDDCNDTGLVDLLDHSDLTQCLSGPGVGLVKDWCDCFDIDNDNDVDLSDIAEFQRAFGRG